MPSTRLASQTSSLRSWRTSSRRKTLSRTSTATPPSSSSRSAPRRESERRWNQSFRLAIALLHLSCLKKCRCYGIQNEIHRRKRKASCLSATASSPLAMTRLASPSPPLNARGRVASLSVRGERRAGGTSVTHLASRPEKMVIII